MSLEQEPQPMDHLDLTSRTGGSGASDDPGALLRLLDHLAGVQSQLDQVTSQLGALQHQDEVLRQGLAKLNLQVERARQLQRDLLPRSLPESSSIRISTLYLPANELSGDTYDAFVLSDDQLAISIADATGHDMAASMLSIFMRQSLRARAGLVGEPLLHHPHELLRALNNELVAAELSDCHFLASIYGVYDETDQCLLWSRGGMPYPILVRHDQPPQKLVSEGGLIGAFEHQQYDLVSTHLQAGDVMLLFSDGLEAFLLNTTPGNPPRDLLETAWCKTLNSRTLQSHLSELEQSVRTSSENDWPADDITILGLEGI